MVGSINSFTLNHPTVDFSFKEDETLFSLFDNEPEAFASANAIAMFDEEVPELIESKISATAGDPMTTIGLAGTSALPFDDLWLSATYATNALPLDDTGGEWMTTNDVTEAEFPGFGEGVLRGFSGLSPASYCMTGPKLTSTSSRSSVSGNGSNHFVTKEFVLDQSAGFSVGTLFLPPLAGPDLRLVSDPLNLGTNDNANHTIGLTPTQWPVYPSVKPPGGPFGSSEEKYVRRMENPFAKPKHLRDTVPLTDEEIRIEAHRAACEANWRAERRKVYNKRNNLVKKQKRAFLKMASVARARAEGQPRTDTTF